MFKRKRGYKRLVKTIQKIAGVEIKYFTYAFGPLVIGPGWQALTTAPKALLGSCIVQGIQNNQMIGNNLYLRKVMIEVNVCFDDTNAAPGNINNPNNMEQWQYRLVVIKPYNLTDFMANYTGVSNQRLPGGAQALYTPIDFQAGKVIIDKIYRISPSITWAQNNSLPFDSSIPNEKTHKFKLNVFKEYLCDPGSNIWQKDIAIFIYTNQFVGLTGAFKNISIKGAHTIFYTDA